MDVGRLTPDVESYMVPNIKLLVNFLTHKFLNKSYIQIYEWLTRKIRNFL